MICCKFKGHIGLSPLMCVMSSASSEFVPHLFFHCSEAESSWNSLFDIVGECWVCPRTLDQLLSTSFIGFEKRNEAKSLWRCPVYTTIWCIYLERNSSTFNDRISDNHILWDKIRHLASTWCKALDLFRGISF